MLTIPSEIHHKVGVEVWRAGVDPGLAREFAAETREWLDRVKPEGLPEDGTYFRGGLANEVCQSGRWATAHVLGALGATTAAHGVNFIHRPPGTSDGFHQDNCYDEIYVVHGDDGSALDVARCAVSAEEAEHSGLLVIHFSAGDIVRHTKPWLFHQGRNPTDHSQVSLAVRELPPFEERFGIPPYPRVA